MFFDRCVVPKRYRKYRVDPAKLVNARKMAGLSQTEVYCVTGIPISQISAHENGRVRVGIGMAVAYAHLYGVSVEDLISPEDEVGIVGKNNNG